MFGQAGNPAGFAPGAYVNCRFFTEAPDGTRTEQGASAFGSYATGPVTETGSYWDVGLPYVYGIADLSGPFSVAASTRVVVVCQNEFGDGLLNNVNATWNATPVDSVEWQ